MTATMDGDTTTVEEDIAIYLEEVSSHLADIEPEELEDLLDDLAVHLREVRGESDEPFALLLGDPAAFAAELRQSAGFGAAPESGRRSSKIASQVSNAASNVREHPWVAEVAAFLPELRPAWWVARGYLVVCLLTVIGGNELSETFPVPPLLGNPLIGFVAVILAVVASVRWGRTQHLGVGRRVGLILASGAAVVGAFVFFGSSTSGGDVIYVDGPFNGQPDYTILPANIYAYDLEGNPLEGVLLYNETGDPVDLPLEGFSEQTGQPFTTTYPIDARGRGVPNLYPRYIEYLDWNERGEVWTPGLPPIVGVPSFGEPADAVPPEPATPEAPVVEDPVQADPPFELQLPDVDGS